MRYDYISILNRTDLNDIIYTSTTFAEIMRRCGLPGRGKMGTTLKKKLIDAGYDLSHLTGIPKHSSRWKTLDEHLSKNSNTQSSKLKNILFKHNLKQNKCEICGITEWQNKPLTMQLHHIDGDPTNNELQNLLVLCPNCHSQTDNFCSSKK